MTASFRRRYLGLGLVLAALLPACASLGALQQVLQAPRLENASGRQAELRLLAPSLQRPLGGIAVRMWTRVSNPNPVGITLTSLAGNLYLEQQHAADVSFPLGLPLPAAGDTVIPLEVGISFSDLPGLRDVAQRSLAGSPLAYRLDGTILVDAGMLGQPSFGPMSLLSGEIRTR